MYQSPQEAVRKWNQGGVIAVTDPWRGPKLGRLVTLLILLLEEANDGDTEELIQLDEDQRKEPKSTEQFCKRKESPTKQTPG
jgi:hypothetical protein